MKSKEKHLIYNYKQHKTPAIFSERENCLSFCTNKKKNKTELQANVKRLLYKYIKPMSYHLFCILIREFLSFFIHIFLFCVFIVTRKIQQTTEDSNYTHETIAMLFECKFTIILNLAPCAE